MRNSLVGRNIRRLRHERGVTQWQLACAIGCTTGALWMIEHGERECSPEQLRAIAKALNVTENQIVGK